jgi:hypothetical protein
MAENQEPDSEQAPTDAGGESANVKRMREQLESLQQEREALMSRVKISAFKEAGLDVDSGIGKAVYRTYEGDIDPDKIREFAQVEYEWEPPQPEAVSPAAQRMETVGQAGTQEAGKTRLQQADDAAGQGDWVNAGKLKDAELLALTNKRFGYQ